MLSRSRLRAVPFAVLAATASPIAMPQAQAQGVTVAVVDTGVDLTHPEFAGRILPGVCFSTTTCPTAVRTGDDDNHHGSHVAGIIAAANNGVGMTGVAPTARILPVKVLAANGSGTTTTIAQGVDFARINRARVINMSLGGGGGSTTLLTALRNARAGSVLVAAAGNDGNAYRPLWPAAYATDTLIAGSMLIVGSVNSSNVISRFSNTPGTGGCVGTGAAQRCWRDFFVVAPGENIVSTGKDGNYVRMSGTSMATPYVSGVAALVIGRSPHLTPAQVVDIIKRSAVDLGARGVDAVYGWGLVSPTRALNPVGATTVATGGGWTKSVASTGEVSTSSLSGPWTSALRLSAAINNAVMFDEFQREFSAGLGARIEPAGFSAFAALVKNPASWEAKTFVSDGVYMQAVTPESEINSVAALHKTDDQTQTLERFVMIAQIAPGTEVMTGHKTSSAGYFNALDLAGSATGDDVFLSGSALNSPYLSLTDGGSFAGVRTEIAEGLRLGVGQSWYDAADEALADDGVLRPEERTGEALTSRAHLRKAASTTAALDYAASQWLQLGAIATYTEEENSLLGSEQAGALALIGDAKTISMGMAARADLGDGWSATASWSAGRSDVTPAANSLFAAVGEVVSQAYGVALTKAAVFSDDDQIGIAVSRPMHVTRGAAKVKVSTGVTSARDIIYTEETLNLATSTPETQIEAGYSTRLDERSHLSVSAIYQQNVDGESGRDSVGAVVRFRLEF
jgi:hypothetical protein